MRSVNLWTIKPINVLYSSFVRSLLEYASQVWNPQYEVYKSSIEGIQNFFCGVWTLKHSNCHMITLVVADDTISLEYRRLMP